MARDPGDLYQVSPDAPELDDIPMLYYLDGFIDAGGHLRHFSDAASDLLGLSATDVGRPFDWLRPRLGGIALGRTVARSALS